MISQLLSASAKSFWLKADLNASNLGSKEGPERSVPLQKQEVVRFPGHSVPTFSISVFFLPSRVQSIVLCSFGPWVPIHHMSLTPLTQTMVQSWACLLFCISYLSYSFSLFVPCDCDPLAVWIGAKLSQFSQGFAYSITTSPRADNSTTHVQGWDTASSFTTCWRWHELLW